MCGICGIIDFNKNNFSKDILKNMCSAMTHRGPDAEGIYYNEKQSVALGHRRLSIIDLSTSGSQPMSNEDGTIWIVMNGEIYNYKELRIELEKKRHVFKSQSDTEVVIHLYEEYAEDCVKYLRGMFAFAIWDQSEQSLMVFRDRVGKKPLIYSYTNNCFCFASEFAALIESGLLDKQINLQAVDFYLTFGYIPAPLTIYKDIFKLPPAHRLVLKQEKIKIESYWHLDYSQKLNISENEASEEVLRLLKEAVKIRLYSDVPLGAFLSGGIDSSTIVALMSEVSSKRVKTFSIGFEEEEFNELGYARIVAERFNTDHNEFIVKANALEVLPLLIERYGEPYADSSCIPTYYVSKQTRESVTVALNGDGGDESFAGYERYQAMLGARYYQSMPWLVKKMIQGFADFFPDSINSKNKIRKIKKFLEGVELPTSQKYMRWIAIFNEDLKKDIYSENMDYRIKPSESIKFIDQYIKNSNGLSLLDSLLMTDTNTYLPYDLLVKMDITSMANSLEARSPFLDHKLMEFVASLPSKYKMKKFVKKYLLKKAIKGIVPDENIDRKKMGFGVPVGKWFRNELKEFLCSTLLSKISLKRGYFKRAVIENMVENHVTSKKDYTFQLWSLLTLELWHQRFIDQ